MTMTEVFTLPQMETVTVVPGDSMRMAAVVGARKNLHFSGTTSGTRLQEVFKSDLKNAPLLPTSDKHSMMQGARVKDDARATSGAKGFLLAILLLP